MNHAELTFPGGSAEILYSGYSESFDPSVERTEMERGVPKQRLVNSQVLVKIRCTLFFRSAANQEAFEAWYFNTIKRIGWFPIEHPRTSATVQARFEGGSIGDLIPLYTEFRYSKRDVTLEYLR